MTKYVFYLLFNEWLITIIIQILDLSYLDGTFVGIFSLIFWLISLIFICFVLFNKLKKWIIQRGLGKKFPEMELNKLENLDKFDNIFDYFMRD